MIHLKKALSLFSVAVLISVIFALSGCTSFANHHAQQQQYTAKSDKPRWLFVISAPGAQIKQLSATKAELMIDGNQFDRNIMFSDRPNRYVKYVTFKALKRQWSLGNNNFKNDPPNAVIAAPNVRPTIVKLTNYHLKGHMVYFTMTNLQDNTPFPHHIKRFMLMIDSTYWWGCECGLIGPIFPSEVGGKGCKAPAGWKPPSNWKCNSNNTSCSLKW